MSEIFLEKLKAKMKIEPEKMALSLENKKWIIGNQY